MQTNRFLILFLFLGLTLSSCATTDIDSQLYSENFKVYLDKKFDEALARQPEGLTYLGIKKDYDKLGIWTEERSLEDLNITKANLKEVKKNWSPKPLSSTGQISYSLYKKDLEDEIAAYKFRHHNYPLSPNFGFHSELPSFLINFHKISSVEDAEAYISRVHEVKRVVAEALVQLKIREENGIILPLFLFDDVTSEIEGVLKGFPLTKTKTPHILHDDFVGKIAALKIKKNEKRKLQDKLDLALNQSFKPAYESLLSHMKELKKSADDRAGVWKFPNGKEFYEHALRRYTTTELSAESIHQLGLKETQRIHKEMKSIMKQVGFDGDLMSFFKKMQTDKAFYYPNTRAGRDRYIKDTNKIISTMKASLPELFSVLPDVDIVVKPVEKFREKSAAMAFYTGPAPDGSRPGIYYVNLFDLTHVPKFEMEALAYHEAIPGHHMQISLAQNLESLPKFRRFGGYTAYTEGWGLYAESIPKDIGFYKDPYSDFGRLSMELMRAGRLVVDTGIHFKKWSRDEAVKWLDENTPESHSDNLKAIDRYIVMPGQATAYKIGMLKIAELRDRSARALGEKFDLRKFHDTVLREGALPLDVLEKLVEDWIMTQKKS